MKKSILSIIVFPMIFTIFANLSGTKEEIRAKLQDAITSWDLKEVEPLLKKLEDVNFDIWAWKGKDKIKIPLIHFAVQRFELGIIQNLIEKGANINAEDVRKYRPLHLAVKRRNLDIVNYLLQKGADFNAQDNIDWTPLHIAAKKGYLKIVEALVGKDADVNVQDRNGWSPLHFAAYECRIKTYKYLKDKGADTKSENNAGKKPWQLFPEGCISRIIEWGIKKIKG